MVLVPGGAFQMGDNFGDDRSNETVHTVTVSSFYMDKTEVTQEAYTAWAGANPSYFVKANQASLPADTSNYPVERVSWNSANAYCSAQGKRLPTEAEWEYSARNGGQVVRYGTGSDNISCATANIWGGAGAGCYNTATSYGGGPSPVGHYAPNALGLYDMAGNVWEWASDWYGVYPAGPVTNPTGPGSGTYKVFRGGSWNNYASDVRASGRSLNNPAGTIYNFGFRCAQ
jgi:formylglycine-generating enzyme required for sulfatase activity